MKTKLFLSLLLSLCVTVFTTTLYAGIKPSPFRAETNKLEAVVLVTEALDMRLASVADVPIDPISPAMEGVIGKLEAMEIQLLVLDGRVADVVAGWPPDPILPEDTFNALSSVRDISEVVYYRVEGIIYDWRELFDDWPPIHNVLMGIKDGAESIIDRVTPYLDPVGVDPL